MPGPNNALRSQIAVYLDAIQSDLAYLFQEGIAKDDAIAKQLRQERSKVQPPSREAGVFTMEGLAKRVATISGGDDLQPRS